MHFVRQAFLHVARELDALRASVDGRSNDPGLERLVALTSLNDSLAGEDANDKRSF